MEPEPLKGKTHGVIFKMYHRHDVRAAVDYLRQGIDDILEACTGPSKADDLAPKLKSKIDEAFPDLLGDCVRPPITREEYQALTKGLPPTSMSIYAHCCESFSLDIIHIEPPGDKDASEERTCIVQCRSCEKRYVAKL